MYNEPYKPADSRVMLAFDLAEARSRLVASEREVARLRRLLGRWVACALVLVLVPAAALVLR